MTIFQWWSSSSYHRCTGVYAGVYTCSHRCAHQRKMMCVALYHPLHSLETGVLIEYGTRLKPARFSDLLSKHTLLLSAGVIGIHVYTFLALPGILHSWWDLNLFRPLFLLGKHCNPGRHLCNQPSERVLIKALERRERTLTHIITLHFNNP